MKSSQRTAAFSAPRRVRPTECRPARRPIHPSSPQPHAYVLPSFRQNANDQPARIPHEGIPAHQQVGRLLLVHTHGVQHPQIPRAVCGARARSRRRKPRAALLARRNRGATRRGVQPRPAQIRGRQLQSPRPQIHPELRVGQSAHVDLSHRRCGAEKRNHLPQRARPAVHSLHAARGPLAHHAAAAPLPGLPLRAPMDARERHGAHRGPRRRTGRVVQSL